MEQVKVAEFLEENKDLLFPNNEYSDFDVEEALLLAPDDFEYTMRGIPFRKPKTVQLISIFPGSLGVDRFYLGEIGKGILKYFTFAGLGIWWIKDIFSAKSRCRAYNCKKLMEAINDPSVAGAMQDTDNKINKTIEVAKKFAPVAKELAKGAKDVGKTFYVKKYGVIVVSQNAIEMYNQGYYYYTGDGGYPLNRHKAMECFRAAADMGVSHAMNYLGIIYENGEIVAQDYVAAAEWFQRAVAADRENLLAAYNLGRMYYNGTGVAKNMERAFELYKTVTDRGNTNSAYPESCFMVGCILMEHYKNNREAYQYFIAAAKHGNITEAWYNLGYLTENGFSTLPQSADKADKDSLARDYYLEAANAGYAPAMDAVGRLYIYYNMLKKGKPWVEKAASMGYEPAKKRLKMLSVSQSGSLWDLFK